MSHSFLEKLADKFNKGSVTNKIAKNKKQTPEKNNTINNKQNTSKNINNINIVSEKDLNDNIQDLQKHYQNYTASTQKSITNQIYDTRNQVGNTGFQEDDFSFNNQMKKYKFDRNNKQTLKDSLLFDEMNRYNEEEIEFINNSNYTNIYVNNDRYKDFNDEIRNKNSHIDSNSNSNKKSSNFANTPLDTEYNIHSTPKEMINYIEFYNNKNNKNTNNNSNDYNKFNETFKSSLSGYSNYNNNMNNNNNNSKHSTSDFFHKKRKSNISIFKFDKTLANHSEKQIELKASFNKIAPVILPDDDYIIGDFEDEVLASKTKSIHSFLTHKKSEEKIFVDRVNSEVSEFNYKSNDDNEENKEPVLKKNITLKTSNSKSKFSNFNSNNSKKEEKTNNLSQYKYDTYKNNKDYSYIINNNTFDNDVNEEKQYAQTHSNNFYSNNDSNDRRERSLFKESNKNTNINNNNINNNEDNKTNKDIISASFIETKSNKNKDESSSISQLAETHQNHTNSFHHEKYIDINEICLLEAVIYQVNNLLENLAGNIGDISCLLLKFSQISLNFRMSDAILEKNFNQNFVLLFVFSGTCLLFNAVNMLMSLNNNSDVFISKLNSNENSVVLKTLKNIGNILHQNILIYIYIMKVNTSKSGFNSNTSNNKESNNNNNEADKLNMDKQFSTSLLRASYPRNNKEILNKIETLYEEACMSFCKTTAKKTLISNNKTLYLSLKNILKKLRTSELIKDLNNSNLVKLVNSLKTIISDLDNAHFVLCKDKILENYESLLNETIEEMKKSNHYNTYNNGNSNKEGLDIINSRNAGSYDKCYNSSMRNNINSKSNNYLLDSNNNPPALGYLKTINEETYSEINKSIDQASSLNTPIKNDNMIEKSPTLESKFTNNSKFTDNIELIKESSQEQYEENNYSNDNNSNTEVVRNLNNELKQNVIDELPTPYLPPITDLSKNTLVLDLDETLVHYVEDTDNAFIQVRPGAEDFIEDMSNYYELVIFTAAMQDYADLVLDQLDPNGYINHRLYRQHTKQVNGGYIKDLSLLGRDLKRTIIVDNVEDNFQLQPNNGIHIKNFEGSEDDVELQLLGYELKRIAVNKLDLIKEITYIKRILEENAKFFEEEQMKLRKLNK